MCDDVNGYPKGLDSAGESMRLRRPTQISYARDPSEWS
jgi:hypothetical protein